MSTAIGTVKRPMPRQDRASAIAAAPAMAEWLLGKDQSP